MNSGGLWLGRDLVPARDLQNTMRASRTVFEGVAAGVVFAQLIALCNGADPRVVLFGGVAVRQIAGDLHKPSAAGICTHSRVHQRNTHRH